MAHPDIGRGLLDQLSDQLRPHGSIEQTPRMEGRTMTMFMNPLKPKQAPAGAQRSEATSEPESLGRMSTSETPGTAQGSDATSGAERNETHGQAEAENA